MIWRFTLQNDEVGGLVLDDEPIGWADISLNITRDLVSHGLFFDFVESLSFYGLGHAFLKTVYNDHGIDSYTSLLVEMKCNDLLDFETVYSGKLLMGKITFDCTDACIATCPLDPAGCLMQFKNRIDQPVDLNANKDFDNNTLATYSHLPFTLQLEPKTIILKEIAHSATGESGDGTDETGMFVIPEYISPLQHVASGIGTQHVSDETFMSLPTGVIEVNELGVLENITSIGDYSTAPIIITADKTGTFSFDYTLDRIRFSVGSLTSAGVAHCSGTEKVEEIDVNFRIEVNGTVVYDYSMFHDISCTGPRFFDLTGFHFIHDEFIGHGDIVKIYIRVLSAGTWHRDLIDNVDIRFIYNDNSNLDPEDTTKAFQGHVLGHLNVTEKLYDAPTDAEVYMVNESFSRIVESITDNCMKVKSDYFGRTDSQPYASESDGCGSCEVITKGLLIRGFPPSDTVMALSFKDMMESMSAIHNLGYGVEDDTDREGYQRIRIEPMEYFYDSTVVLTLDNVPNIKKTIITDWFKSTIETGYSKWETENSMGLDEIATKRSYRTTLKEVQSTASILCKFIASGYSIEVTRNIEYVAASTKDWRYDNDIFIICVKHFGTAYYVEQGQDCADTGSMTDVIDPDTIYNYRISPVRNFMRWVKSFMGAYFNDINSANAKFIFTDGNGNFLAKGKLVNGCIEEADDIKENDDIDITDFLTSDLAKPIFKYENDSFDYPLSFEDFNALKANPRGTINYRTKSTDDYTQGFIYSISYKPNDGLASFKLIPKFT